MRNNTIKFHKKDDLEIDSFHEEKQMVLEARSPDLRQTSTMISSLQNFSTEQLELDINTLTKSQLNQKYKTTHSSWRNMKQRAKKEGQNVHNDFEEFSSFLRIMGPRPHASYTLDRIDFNNPLYGPGLCRWLDKTGQANNRRSTIHLTSTAGECLPLTIWADRTGQKPDTMRRQRKSGWTDQEVINGQRTNSLKGKTPKFDPDPMPWRGNDNHVLGLENRYLFDINTKMRRFPNRYVAYERYIKLQIEITSEMLRRASGIGDDFVWPPDEVSSREYYEAQLEPLGDQDRIEILEKLLDHLDNLSREIKAEHLAWSEAHSKQQFSENDLKLLKAIRRRTSRR